MPRVDRREPPVQDWPGRMVTEDDVREADGHPKEWFPLEWRLEAHRNAWGRFWQAREERAGAIPKGWDWDQVMIVGEYGKGKSQLAALLSLKYGQMGRPVFSTGSKILWGWYLDGEEALTSFGLLPYGALFVIDEAHSTLNRYVGHGVGVSTFVSDEANIRRLMAKVLVISGQDYMVTGNVRDNSRRVFEPVPVDVDLDLDGPGRYSPREDPSNFVLRYNVFTNYPYRQANIKDRQGRRRPFPKPSYHETYWGEPVRQALMLTDSFMLADPAVARNANSERVKDRVRARSGTAPGGKEDWRAGIMGALYQFCDAPEYAGRDYVKAGEIGGIAGTSPRQVGEVVQALPVEVSWRRGKGYNLQELRTALDALEGQC